MIEITEGAVAKPLPLPAASQAISGRAGRLMGWSVRETSGTATATFRLWNTTTASGVKVATVSLNAGESSRDYLPAAVDCEGGLYFELVSGALEGSVWFVVDGQG